MGKKPQRWGWTDPKKQRRLNRNESLLRLEPFDGCGDYFSGKFLCGHGSLAHRARERLCAESILHL
jgi:hypothetical protein